MKWKDAVYSRYYDAETVKTDRYMYTEFQDSTGNAYARMLYDHEEDYKETIDISKKPENKALIERLSQLLEERESMIPDKKHDSGQTF